MGCNLRIQPAVLLVKSCENEISTADAWRPAGNRPLAAWWSVQGGRGCEAVEETAPHTHTHTHDSSLAWQQDKLWTTASWPGNACRLSRLLVLPDERWGGWVRMGWMNLGEEASISWWFKHTFWSSTELKFLLMTLQWWNLSLNLSVNVVSLLPQPQLFLPPSLGGEHLCAFMWAAMSVWIWAWRLNSGWRIKDADLTQAWFCFWQTNWQSCGPDPNTPLPPPPPRFPSSRSLGSLSVSRSELRPGSDPGLVISLFLLGAAAHWFQSWTGLRGRCPSQAALVSSKGVIVPAVCSDNEGVNLSQSGDAGGGLGGGHCPWTQSGPVAPLCPS